MKNLFIIIAVTAIAGCSGMGTRSSSGSMSSGDGGAGSGTMGQAYSGNAYSADQYGVQNALGMYSTGP